MSYFKAKDDSYPAGQMQLEPESMIMFVDENQIQKKHCFAVVTRDRNYYVFAESESEMVEWVLCLRGAVYYTCLKKVASDPRNFMLLRSDISTNIERNGWLKKQGGKIKTMKRRFFVLKDRMLSYYRTEKDLEPIGSIDITGSNMTLLTKKKEYGINIHTTVGSNRQYYLAADNESEQLSWFDSLVKSVENVSEAKLVEKKSIVIHSLILSRMIHSSAHAANGGDSTEFAGSSSIAPHSPMMWRSLSFHRCRPQITFGNGEPEIESPIPGDEAAPGTTESGKNDSPDASHSVSDSASPEDSEGTISLLKHNSRNLSGRAATILHMTAPPSKQARSEHVRSATVVHHAPGSPSLSPVITLQKASSSALDSDDESDDEDDDDEDDDDIDIDDDDDDDDHDTAPGISSVSMSFFSLPVENKGEQGSIPSPSSTLDEKPEFMPLDSTTVKLSTIGTSDTTRTDSESDEHTEDNTASLSLPIQTGGNSIENHETDFTEDDDDDDTEVDTRSVNFDDISLQKNKTLKKKLTKALTKGIIKKPQSQQQQQDLALNNIYGLNVDKNRSNDDIFADPLSDILGDNIGNVEKSHDDGIKMFALGEEETFDDLIVSSPPPSSVTVNTSNATHEEEDHEGTLSTSAPIITIKKYTGAVSSQQPASSESSNSSAGKSVNVGTVATATSDSSTRTNGSTALEQRRSTSMRRPTVRKGKLRLKKKTTFRRMHHQMESVLQTMGAEF